MRWRREVKSVDDPHDSPAMDQNINELVERSLKQHAAGRLREAEEGYRQALQSDPNHHMALHYLGVLAHQMKQHDAAISLMRRSIELQPKIAAYHNNLGDAYRAAGDIPAAREAFARAVSLDPDDALAHNNLGVVLTQQRQFDR